MLPLETSVLAAAFRLRRRGSEEFHGFLLAKEIKDLSGARSLTGHGTLYKALARLEKSGLLVSRWEDPTIAASERRPQRRLYQVSTAGEAALMVVRQEKSGLHLDSLEPRLVLP